MHCLQWKTPFEMRNEKSPDVSYLKVFGCAAMSISPEPIQNKLSPASEMMIFIGYVKGSKAII